MRAMLLEPAGNPLPWCEVEPPAPGPGQVRMQLDACAVRRIDTPLPDGILKRVADPSH